MRKLFISSSTYLMPSNNIWHEKKIKFLFDEFNGWPQSLKKEAKNDFILILILKDIFLENSKNSKKLKVIESLLKEFLIKNKNNNLYLLWIPLENDFNLNDKVEKIYKKLGNLFENFYSTNLDNLFRENGYNKYISQRNYYLINSWFSRDGIEVIINNIRQFYDKLNYPRKKILVLDCDNTLWGGVIGEDGISNLKLGQDGVGRIYQDFQREILKIKKRGLLLGISSKNNYQDVIDVIKNHEGMILKNKDFVIKKINWKPKSENITNISNELGLGLSSFSFWDDNPLERREVSQNAKEVEVIGVPKNIEDWPQFLKNISNLNPLKITNEDKKKTKQYEARFKFIKKSSTAKNKNHFLKNIKLRPKIIKINRSNISRAAQLTQKTNQFNLTTKRYTVTDLNNTNDLMFLVSLKDIFGDHGIISFVKIKKINKEICLIDTFLMSCRILGREIENWILNEAINKCKRQGFKKILGNYVPTKKNIMVNNFYLSNNFKLHKNNKYLKNLKGKIFIKTI